MARMFNFSTSVALACNGLGLGEGGLVGCSILAQCVCPLLPSPCYVVVFFFIFCVVGVFF